MEFKVHVFISYAHIDNDTLETESHRAPNAGWVEQFHRRLEFFLNQRAGRLGAVKIWRDIRLEVNTRFDAEIAEKIDSAAVCVALVSNGYLKSDYCRKELAHFCEKAKREPLGLVVNNRSRILQIRLNNIPHSRWPDELEGTSGLKFFQADRDHDLGWPLDPATPPFNAAIREAADAIYTFLQEAEIVEKEKSRKEARAPDPVEGTVFVAEVSETQRVDRKRLISELKQRGIEVWEQVVDERPVDCIPPPYRAQKHDAMAREAITQSDLSIHLLNQWPGALVEQGSDTYPQRQIEIALNHGKGPIIWIPNQLRIDDVEDEQHRSLIERLEAAEERENDYQLFKTLPNQLADQVKSALEARKQRTAAKSSTSTPAAALLDTHAKDQLLAIDAGRFLLEQKQIRPLINPLADDPHDRFGFVRDQLNRVGVVIIFFGDVSFEWVKARITEAIKMVITEGCPVRGFGIYLASPNHDSSDISLQVPPFLKLHLLDNRHGFDPKSFNPLLEVLE